MIRFEGIAKAYGDKQVLKGVTFAVEQGERVLIGGASGSGKTTLFRLLLALEKPDAGEIVIDPGKKIACVFQEDRIAESLNALGNLTLTGVSKGEARRHLRAVRLEGEENTKISALSGGMKRRVAIARAVSVRPDILVLDEPFTGIDAATRKICGDYIQNELPGVTILMTTHEAEDKELMGIRRTYTL